MLLLHSLDDLPIRPLQDAWPLLRTCRIDRRHRLPRQRHIDITWCQILLDLLLGTNIRFRGIAAGLDGKYT